MCIPYSAFDTLAKVFNPSEENLSEKSQCVSETTIQLIGQDQETPIIEVEGPLLTDSHVSFKVGGVHLKLIRTTRHTLYTVVQNISALKQVFKWFVYK